MPKNAGSNTARLGIDLLETLTHAPGRRLDVDRAACLLDIDAGEIPAVVDLLASLGDRDTGARVAIGIVDGTIVLTGDAALLNPTRLTAEESLAVASALRSLDVDDAARERITRSILPLGLSATDLEGMVDRTAYGSHYPRISEAIRYGIRLELLYRSGGETTARWRAVDPEAFETQDGSVYLTAWDLHADAQRRYRLDRVEAVRFTDDSVTHHPWRRETIERSLRRHGQLARLAFPGRAYAERLGWAGMGRMTPLADGRGVYSDVSYTSEPWLFDHVLAGGGDIVILAPADLRERFRAYAEELLAR